MGTYESSAMDRYGKISSYFKTQAESFRRYLEYCNDRWDKCTAGDLDAYPCDGCVFEGEQAAAFNCKMIENIMLNMFKQLLLDDEAMEAIYQVIDKREAEKEKNER